MAEDQDAPAPPIAIADSDESAQRAYAAATEAMPAKTIPKDMPMPEIDTPGTLTLEPAAKAEPAMDAADTGVIPAEAAPAPVAAKRGRKPNALKTQTKPAAAPAKLRKPRQPKPAVIATPAAKAAKAAKPAARKVAAAKAVKAPKPVTVKPAVKPAAKTAAIVAKSVPQAKDRKMVMTSKISDGIKSAVAEAQEKAKTAYSKGSELLGDYTDFTKGNVEAVVESGKILAAGLQGMGTAMVADTKESFETMTADVKAIAAVKSPTELVKLQGEIMRRNLDKAVSYGSKNSEAMLKLANDMFAPLSGRFSLAMDKVRKAA